MIDAAVVRLADVDAPEMAQRCEGGPSTLRRCGAYVADALAERIGDREVRCTVRELDQYDRQIARCEVAGEDLSSWLVSEGLALAQPPLLREARARRGIRKRSGCRPVADHL